jgi:predicted 3-demethylubiquinone-9 3-methyltransferase (glyoxalase superfamily)
MAQSKLQKIATFLWYKREAVEAARFYTTLFPDSRVDRVSSLPSDSPSGPAGSVEIVEFTLFGQSFKAMSAGPHHDFNDAISLMVSCETQAELDKYWDGILKHGGKPQACGWITDKYGVRWQIVPTALLTLMADPDPAKAARTAKEMLSQVKFDIARLEAAYNGR